jgi:hypothetical protein
MTGTVPSTDQPAETQPPASAESAAPAPEVAVDVNVSAPGAADANVDTAEGRTYRQRLIDAPRRLGRSRPAVGGAADCGDWFVAECGRLGWFAYLILRTQEFSSACYAK